MLKSRFPVIFLKGTLGLCLAVLLIAPAAVLWSAADLPTPGKGRQPIGRSGFAGKDNPEVVIEKELAWMQRSARPWYDRGEDFWGAEHGPRHLGGVEFAALRSPHTLILPNNKGSVDTRRGRPQVAESLRKDVNAPGGMKGAYLIAQFSEQAIRGKSTKQVRQMLGDLGVEVLGYVPNNAYLLRVKGKDRQKVLSSPKFQFVDAYHPAYKIERGVGLRPVRDPGRANSDELDLVIRSHKYADKQALLDDIGRHGRVTHVQEFDGVQIVGVKARKHDLFKLANIDDVASIHEKQDMKAMSYVTSITVEMGRLLDPRRQGGFIRPFLDDGIDGGGVYGGTFDASNTGELIDPNLFVIPPQFVGLVDNGLDLDSGPLAHSRLVPCALPTTDCSALSTGVGVGPGHRKVEMYVRADDHNHDGTQEDSTAEGDFLSCSTIESGGRSHGHVAAGTMLGNPSDGPLGLGFYFDDTDNSDQFFSFANDEHEVNLPLDGQAPGARLLFIDATGTGTPTVGPPPCATQLQSDVDVGTAVIDELQTLVYRRDLNLANNTVHPRGAKIAVFPFGYEINFDNNVYNGQGDYTYAQDFDTFLFNNRRVTVVVPVGNDGASPTTGRKRDPYIPTDANDGVGNDPLIDPEDIQIQNLATGKNTITVGSNLTSTLSRDLLAQDATANINGFSSKGPATASSLRIAPTVVAPGFDASKGGGGREGEYGDDYFVSHTVVMSIDDQQNMSNPKGTDPIENVRVQDNRGTSFSAAKVGGVAAQIRDYFAKGYYPGGFSGSGASVTDMSGALVKAIIVGSTAWASQGLIGNCQNAFCIEQGYGKVELANILPLRSYPQTRRPNDQSNLEYVPDVPAGILVADELFDGGLGLGVVELGGYAEFPFTVFHGGASVRVALAWDDAPGETLINNLDLHVIDSDWERAPNWGAQGSGVCSATNYGGFPWTCGYCTYAAMANPDPTYYDPTSNNPYVRRYLGNHLVDGSRFSEIVWCDPGTGAPDVADPASIPDTDHTTEMVHLWRGGEVWVLDLFALTLPGSQGMRSSGYFKAIVEYPDTGNQVGAPNTPCIAPGTNGTIESTPGGNDVILVTGDGMPYVASGVDNVGTPAVDEAQCDTTATGDDVQLVSNGNIGQPFGLVITGPIGVPGLTKSTIAFDKNSYDCSDQSLNVRVTEEDELIANRTAHMQAGTVLQVLDSVGTVVDQEESIPFGTCRSFSGWRTWSFMCYDSSDVRVQYIGGLSRSPIADNGILEVNDGDTIRATYTDPTEPTDTAATEAKVVCGSMITQGFVNLANYNYSPKFVTGGCDLGRNLNLRGDFNLDAGETVQYQVFGNNHSGYEIRDLTATLRCQNPAGTTENPCQYLDIVNPVRNVGRVPLGREIAATWTIHVDENVVNLSTSSEKVVEMVIDFSGTNTDQGQQINQQFVYREALHADTERLWYSTDHPFGGTAVVDINRNGQIERDEFNNGLPREIREVRTYQTWVGTTNASLLTDCGGASCIPFSFDSNDGHFNSDWTYPRPRMSGDSKPGSGFPTASQGWFWGTAGGCGWQTQGSTGGSAAPKGVWHAGFGPIPTVGSGCGQYVVPSDPSTGPQIEFVTHLLRSPVFNKVNTGTDARGFEFDVRMEVLAWNANEELADGETTFYIEIDTNIDDDGPITLGDTYSYRPPFTISRTLVTSPQGARRFGPTFDPDNSLALSGTATGDEVGISRPLPAYDAGNFLVRPNLPYPAADADDDPNTGFTSDTTLSTGPSGPCPSVPAGLSCRLGGFTTPSGPERNRDYDTNGSFEDFNGASGDRFQFEFTMLVTEGGSQATGYTIDDVVFEWSEEHPTDQADFTGGDCSLDNLAGYTCVANTCGGGSPRDGLFCNTVTDCRRVIIEGDCVSGTCVAGRVGLSCSVDNDCDLGACESGNTQLGCGVDADCNLNTNDCDAIPFRVGPVTGGNSAVARQCAMIDFEKGFLFDCTSSIHVTVADSTPDLCGPSTDVNHDGQLDGCTISPAQILVNARNNIDEPLGEWFRATEASPGSGIFEVDVPLSGVSNLPGLLFSNPNPGENVLIFVSYADPECDLDRDGEIGESDFRDIDQDGVPNFGVDGTLRDQDPTKSFVTGGPVSDDDNCYNSVALADVYNPVATPQMDLNGDGFIDAGDCVVDTNHNNSGQCDWDSDGVGDICDNCPLIPNNDQLDTDADGIGNLCEDNDIDDDGVINIADNCPTIYNPSQDQITGGGAGGSRFNRGVLCDSGSDVDGDGYDERVDNCPNEQLVEDGSGGYNPGPCPGGALGCTYNPEQRDTDADGIGDVCDSEDYDGDGVINSVDNCPTFYNPADPDFQVQTDTDGDALGDDRRGEDAVGSCVGGPTPGRLCLPVGFGANCGTGGFCVASAQDYCDVDSADDNNNGTPDDLVQFASEIACRYEEGALGATSTEIGQIGLSGVTLIDDGTADHICIAGDPDPNNDPTVIEDCPIPDAGPTGDASCDTPAGPGGDGDCEPVGDGIVDPAETVSVVLHLVNQSVNNAGASIPVNNATVGIMSSSPSIGCITRGQTFIGDVPAGAAFNTPTGGLEFILSPTTGQSTAAKFIEASFSISMIGDRIQGMVGMPSFKIIGDSDQQVFPVIAPACGTAASGSTHDASWAMGGVLCEDFDTDRNSSGSYEFTRLGVAAGPRGPFDLVCDSTDDVLGCTQDGGPTPFGADGQQCGSDAVYSAAAIDCWVVPTENDWHIHSDYEGCGATYDPAFTSDCAPQEFAHSGFRSMHMGRHLNATDTLWDTYRFRQVSAFVMDPVNLGTGSTMEFWHIIQVCDDKCVNAGAGGTTAGGQVHITLLDNNTNQWERWQRLEATANAYNSVDNNVIVICEFDPGDDQLPPNDETMCQGNPGSPQWSDLGELYGSSLDCVTDDDNNDPVDKDCGSTTHRTVDPSCSWLTDPTCGSYLEHGSAGPTGVWARSSFNLSAFAGRKARLRWIFEGGGGWSFGESRSWLEPQSGLPGFRYEQDDGWYVDDIVLTDLRTSSAIIVPDPDNGLSACPTPGDADNCGVINVAIANSGTHGVTGGLVVAGDVSGAGVLLDARQSVAADDPGTGGIVEGNCLGGILEYEWSLLDENGAVADVVAPFSPAGEVLVTPIGHTATYRLDVRCTADPACSATVDVQAWQYTGEGEDLASGDADTTGSTGTDAGLTKGLYIDHDWGTNTAWLYWTAVPQAYPAVNGYDAWKHTISGMVTPATDIFAGNQFQGGAFACSLPQGAVGTTLSTSDTSMPAAGSASLYMIGHNSTNTLAAAPLGYRPEEVSNRAGLCLDIGTCDVGVTNLCLTGPDTGNVCVTDDDCSNGCVGGPDAGNVCTTDGDCGPELISASVACSP